MNNEEGYSLGDKCNRNGCEGIIMEHDLEGGCSCHINPPCSYCETPKEFCPTCNWDAAEEKREEDNKYFSNNYKGFGNKQMHDFYYEQQAKQQEFDKNFTLMYKGEVEADKLIITQKSHTHFSMIKRGVFPKNSYTREQLLNEIRGTFGGRFISLTDYSFEYIAYTD